MRQAHIGDHDDPGRLKKVCGHGDNQYRMFKLLVGRLNLIDSKQLGLEVSDADLVVK